MLATDEHIGLKNTYEDDEDRCYTQAIVRIVKGSGTRVFNCFNVGHCKVVDDFDTAEYMSWVGKRLEEYLRLLRSSAGTISIRSRHVYMCMG